MASIKTVLGIQDNMTRPLKHITSAMGILINTMENMERISGNSIDTAALDEARNHIAQAAAAFDQVEDEINQAGQEQERLNQNIRAGHSAADGLLRKFTGIAAAIGGMMGLKQLVGLSDQLASTKARLSLIVDDGGSVSDLERKIMASAQRSRASYFDTANAIASVGANASSAFSGNDELIAFMEQINKQFVIGGASAQGQAAAMLQLTQAMGAGALRGEELNSILENAPGIARAIEQYMGIAEGSIKKYAEQGLITAEVVKNAMFAAADETNAKFESMPKTWGQIWTSMKNKALSAFEPVLKRINEVFNSSKFQKVSNGVVNGLAMVGSVASAVLDMLISGAEWVIDNWSWISPIIMGVAGAFLVLKGYQIAYNAVQAITNGLAAISATNFGIKAGAMAVDAAATSVATGAQAGFNAALYACPLLWAILLIIALVAAFILLWDNCEGFRKFYIKMWSDQAMAMVDFWNFLVPFINKIIDFQHKLMDATASVCSSIVNAFADMAIYVVENLGFVAEGIKGLVSVYNKVVSALGGKTIDVDLAFSVDGVNAMRDHTINSIDKTFDGIKWNPVQELDRGKVQKIVDDLAAYAEDFRFSEIFGNFIGELEENNELTNWLEKINNNTENTAADTAGIADALDIAEEDLKYLMDIAEREAINRFTTAEIKVEQHNENHIDKDVDVDGIMDAWATDFAEKLDVSPEGVTA